MINKDSITEEKERLIEIRKQHFESSFPQINKYDDYYANIFSSFSTLSATIGAFSFMLFNNEVTIKNVFLSIGDLLLLTVIIFSFSKYIKITRGNHIETLDYYRKFQNKISKCIGFCDEFINEEINEDKYLEKRKKINKETKDSLNNSEPLIPDYSIHKRILIIFIVALIFIGISLIDEKVITNIFQNATNISCLYYKFLTIIVFKIL